MVLSISFFKDFLPNFVKVFFAHLPNDSLVTSLSSTNSVEPFNETSYFSSLTISKYIFSRASEKV
mgnify:FL=1